MSRKITAENVRYIANLSRIYLPEEKLEEFTGQLEKILGFVDHLQKLDVQGVEPTCHVLELDNVYRRDEVKPSFTQKEALQIAIAAENGAFKVPQVIE